MKLLILSDSHGCVETMQAAVEWEKPHAIVHLGDYWADAGKLQRLLPPVPFYQVAGNCDRHRWEPEQTLCMTTSFGGVLCMMVHGHQYGVKSGLLRLCLAAREARAQVALFGHTHSPLCRWEDGILLMNPGSCGNFYGTYGVLTIENGVASGEIRTLRRS